MCPTKFLLNEQEFRAYLIQWTVALILKYVKVWRPYLMKLLGCSIFLKMLLPTAFQRALALLEDFGSDKACWEEVGNRIFKTIEHPKGLIRYGRQPCTYFRISAIIY